MDNNYEDLGDNTFRIEYSPDKISVIVKTNSISDLLNSKIELPNKEKSKK